MRTETGGGRKDAPPSIPFRPGEEFNRIACGNSEAEMIVSYFPTLFLNRASSVRCLQHNQAQSAIELTSTGNVVLACRRKTPDGKIVHRCQRILPVRCAGLSWPGMKPDGDKRVSVILSNTAAAWHLMRGRIPDPKLKGYRPGPILPGGATVYPPLPGPPVYPSSLGIVLGADQVHAYTEWRDTRRQLLAAEESGSISNPITLDEAVDETPPPKVRVLIRKKSSTPT